MISDVGDALDAIIDLTRDKEQAMTNATTQSDIDAETLRTMGATPRSLVGMTMGARKRHALSAQEDDALSRLMRDPLKVLSGHFDAHDNAEQYRKPYRIGQRLRPCPGCAKCDPCMIGYGSFCGGDPRLFTPDETRSTEQERERHRKHCEEWSSGKRLTATDSDKLVEQAPYGLGVSRWTNNSAGTFCDGSGVLPAKRKVRR